MPFVLTEIVDPGGGLRRYLCVEGKGVSLQDSAVRGSALRQDGIFIYCLPVQAADEPGPYLSVRLTGKRVCQWIPFVEVADYADLRRIRSPHGEADSRLAVFLHGMRSQQAVCVEVRALMEQIEVKILYGRWFHKSSPFKFISKAVGPQRLYRLRFPCPLYLQRTYAPDVSGVLSDSAVR